VVFRGYKKVLYWRNCLELSILL